MSSIRCHYVPQFYLNYFLETDSQLLWVYDKKNVSSRPQPPVNTAVIGDYYLSHPNKEGTKDTRMEEFLSSLEGMTKPVLDEWRSNPRQWNEKDKPIVAMFLSFMYSRVPRAVESVKEMNIAGIEHVMDEMKKLTEDPKRIKKHYKNFCVSKEGRGRDVSLEDFKELWSNPNKYGKFTIEIDDKHAVGESFYMAQPIYHWLMSMHWCICAIRNKNFFVTTDAPLNVFLPTGDGKAIFGAGFGMPHVEIVFPLSPKLCLYMSKVPCGKYKYVDASFVEEMNKREVHMAERFIISPYRSNQIRKMVSKFSTHYGMPKIDKEDAKERFKQKWSGIKD